MNAKVINFYEPYLNATLCAGHLLTTVSEGETPLIPRDVTQYSMNCGAESPATLSLLSQLGQGDAPVCQGSPDPVVRCVSGSFFQQEHFFFLTENFNINRR